MILPRPRGWHLDEAHLTLDGQPLVGGLVNFGLYFFHNAAEQLARGSGPYCTCRRWSPTSRSKTTDQQQET